MSKGVISAALAETALVTWRDLSQEKFLPLPSDYAAVIVIYGGLSLLPESASRFSTAFGWGLVIATWFKLWNPASPTKLALPGGSPAAVTPQDSPTSSTPTASPPSTSGRTGAGLGHGAGPQ
jgi:hypothetical protein